MNFKDEDKPSRKVFNYIFLILIGLLFSLSAFFVSIFPLLNDSKIPLSKTHLLTSVVNVDGSIREFAATWCDSKNTIFSLLPVFSAHSIE